MADTRPPADLTILTGADGWFGTAFVHALRDGPFAAGGRVRVLVMDDGQSSRVRSVLPGCEVVIGDITDAASVRSVFDGAGPSTDVVHAAGVIHPARVSDFHRINDQGTATVVAAAVRAGVGRFVHVSSNSPLGTNPTPTDVFRNDEPYRPYLGYGHSKMFGELHVLESGLDAVIVRPPWFYGPYQPARQTAFFTMIRKGIFPLFGDGQQRRSMVYVDNLVQGVAKAARATLADGPRTFWIADARPYPMTEVVSTVREVLREEGYDVKPHRARVPSFVGDLAEAGDRLLQRFGRYQQQLHVLGEMNKTIACDIGAAQHHLGYAPEVALADGMRESIRWCRRNGIEL